MTSYDWNFSPLVPYLPSFVRGVGITIALALAGSVVGTGLGIPMAWILRRGGMCGLLMSGLVDVLRAVPNLVLLFLCYYFPYQQLFGISPVSPFGSAVVALSIAQAAYSADVIRAAVAQVPRDQILGLSALGVSEAAIVRKVVVPSVAKQTMAAHVALWIGNVKLSSLASIIGVPDVVYVARVAMSQSFRSLEAWLLVAATYCAIVLPLTHVQRAIERSAWLRRQ